MSQQAPADHWHESQAERDDRNLAELLQELRVGLGVAYHRLVFRQHQKERDVSGAACG